MKIDEFGRSIKAKYPEYKDVDDTVLGQKMLAKYPEYKSKIDTPEPQFGSAMWTSRNLNKEPGMLQSAASAIGTAAPIVGGTLGDVIGSVVGKGAEGAAGGTGAGLAIGEVIKDVAGVQDKSQQQQAAEAFEKPAAAYAVSKATPLVTRAGGKLLSGAKSALGTLAEKSGVAGFADDVSRAAVNKLTAISQPEYEKFALSAGRDLPEVAGEWLKKSGGDLNKLVGTAKDRFSSGILHFEQKAAEEAIQKTIKNSGDEIIASTDDIVGGLARNIEELNGIAGNESKVGAIQKFIEQTKNLYPNGFTAKDLLKYKRASTAKFGDKVLNTSVGDSALQQAQVDTGNAARAILKSKFPDIAEQLQKEQEIIHLIPILRQQIGKDAVSKSALPEAVNKLHITRPGTFLQAAMDLPAATRFSASGAYPGQQVVNNPTLQQAGKVGLNLLKQGAVNQTFDKRDLQGGGGLGLDIKKTPKYLYK